jgi:hypothetical protein
MQPWTRREFLGTAIAGTAASGVSFPRVARAQSKLTFGLWDHWVPGANDVLKGIITEWGKSNRVEINIDFITSIGNKLDLTSAAEFRAGAGHDIIAFGTGTGRSTRTSWSTSATWSTPSRNSTATTTTTRVT